MKKLLFILLLIASPAFAESFGDSVTATGVVQQLSATTSSGTVTLSPTSGVYVYVANEGANFAYVTCKSGTATVPGGACTTCIPVSPNGGGAILNKLSGGATCAGITSSGTTSVDFTPINIY